MSAHRADVSNLNGIVTRELVLDRQIYGLNIGSLEFVLATIQIQPQPTVDGGVLYVDCGEAIFQSGRLTSGKRQRMLGIRAVESGGINEGIIGAQRAAIAQVAESPISRAVAASDNQLWRNPVGESNPWSEIEF